MATRFGKFCDDDPGLTFILSRLKLQESGLDAAPEREHLGEFGAPVAIFKQGMFGRIYIYIILYYNILYIYNIYIYSYPLLGGCIPLSTWSRNNRLVGNMYIYIYID